MLIFEILKLFAIVILCPIVVIIFACCKISSQYSRIEEMGCDGNCFKCTKTEKCNLYQNTGGKK